MEWYAIAYGALDMREQQFGDTNIELILLPTKPSDPMGLVGQFADLWRRMSEGPVLDKDLSQEERQIVREYAEAGIASSNPMHPARITRLAPPWMSSPFHELTYALTASLARDKGIEIFVIKGPMLHRQGLRRREHSGDIDIWVAPDRIMKLVEVVHDWGWHRMAVRWENSSLYHSLTVSPDSWGCEIDVHRNVPGFALDDNQVFKMILERTETHDFAGVVMQVPDRSTHAVISGLHLMRPQQGLKVDPSNYGSSVRGFESVGPDALKVARALRAEAAILDVLRAAFPDEVIKPSYRPPLNWRWRAEPDRLKRYILLFGTSPVRAWPSMLFRSFWPDEKFLLYVDALHGGNASNVPQARVNHLRRGIAQQFEYWKSAVGRLLRKK